MTPVETKIAKHQGLDLSTHIWEVITHLKL